MLSTPGTPQAEDEALHALERARLHARIRRNMRRFGVGFLAVASIIWVATLLVETAALKEISTLVATASRPADAEDLLAPDVDEQITVRPPSDFLPSSAEGWISQGIQPLPGSDGSVVEGNYTPELEEWSLVTPLVVYVQASDAASGDTQLVERALTSRYTEKQAEITVDGVRVRTGVSADGWSYFMGWVKEGKIFGLEASFRYRVPASGGDAPLRDAGLEMARKVMAHKPGQGGSE